MGVACLQFMLLLAFFPCTLSYSDFHQAKSFCTILCCSMLLTLLKSFSYCINTSWWAHNTWQIITFLHQYFSLIDFFPVIKKTRIAFIVPPTSTCRKHTRCGYIAVHVSLSNRSSTKQFFVLFCMCFVVCEFSYDLTTCIFTETQK